jgi:uncharacterized integral membrane protein
LGTQVEHGITFKITPYGQAYNPSSTKACKCYPLKLWQQTYNSVWIRVTSTPYLLIFLFLFILFTYNTITVTLFAKHVFLPKVIIFIKYILQFTHTQNVTPDPTISTLKHIFFHYNTLISNCLQEFPLVNRGIHIH